MCGRGGLDYDWARLWEYFSLVDPAPAGGIRILNLAPSWRGSDGIHWTRVPVIRSENGERRPSGLVWPLIPRWLKGELPKFSTANCRSESDQPFSETVARKPTFRTAWKRDQRCLVPFSWFYEWDQHSKPKQPWRVLPVDRPFLVMAGLWDRAQLADGDSLESFTIVTTGPNQLMTDIGHHRSPVMLDPGDWECWLSGDKEEAEQLIKPPPDGLMRAQKVTVRVNNPGYQGEDLVAEA